MRSYSYDLLPTYLSQLQGTVITKDDLLKKSKEEDSLGDNIQSIINQHHLGNQLAEKINKAFIDLKSDFSKGEINFAFYKSNLLPLKDFFQSNTLQKSDVPDKLNTKEILIELGKYV